MGLWAVGYGLWAMGYVCVAESMEHLGKLDDCISLRKHVCLLHALMINNFRQYGPEALEKRGAMLPRFSPFACASG